MNTEMNKEGRRSLLLSHYMAMVAMGLKTSLWVTAVLLTSGLIHLVLLVILGTSWDGPVSLRKPALFGISGGLTTWSIAWLMTQLKPRKYDSVLSNLLAVGLLVEVALITVQCWRGVPSHFNHSTNLDAIFEFTMLGLILAATVAIVYLTFRTRQLQAIEPSMALAIQGGMWLLALSCGLGFLTTALGELNMALGRRYELWGRAGVLKFPHGVALHAIQFLPLVAWIALRLKVKNPSQLVQAFLSAQLFFLLYACWQTSQGRARFDWDAIGGILLGITVVIGSFATAALTKSWLVVTFAKSK